MEKSLKEQILELHDKGYNGAQISKTLNCTKSNVSYHIENEKLKNIKDTLIGDVDYDIIKQIIELREQKIKYEDILKQIDISKDKLKKIFNIFKLSFSLSHKNLSKEEINEIQEYYDIHGNIKNVAKVFNISYETLRKYIKLKPPKKPTITKSQSVIQWRKRKKIELVAYKGGCCEICGYNKSISALQFHHRNPNEKDFNISRKSYSFERLKKEVDKCILVCANCHAEIHEKLLEEK